MLKPSLILHFSSTLAQQDVDQGVDIARINALLSVDIGLARIVIGIGLAQHDVDEDVHIVHVHLAVAVHVALESLASGVGIVNLGDRKIDISSRARDHIGEVIGLVLMQ